MMVPLMLAVSTQAVCLVSSCVQCEPHDDFKCAQCDPDHYLDFDGNCTTQLDPKVEFAAATIVLIAVLVPLSLCCCLCCIGWFFCQQGNKRQNTPWVGRPVLAQPQGAALYANTQMQGAAPYANIQPQGAAPYSNIQPQGAAPYANVYTQGAAPYENT
eukprot:GEMP01060365.1.p1 GENE.GEMP01060365.1~~GEMP01060365.1.p1  ORF type:complete len:158 (+),score=28.46 GEMP01060365.1:134-607(+)